MHKDMLKRYFIIVFAIFLVGLAGFFAFHQLPGSQNSETDKLVVQSSIYPLAFVAEQVGGDAVSVTTILPLGAEPHDFQISPQHLLNVQHADLFLYNGANLDTWAEKLVSQATPKKIINMAQELKDAGVTLREEDDHTDPHIWMDLTNMVAETEIIRDAFTQLDPAHAADYRARADQTVAALQKLDSEFQTGLATCRLRKIIVTHDAFAYAAQRYQIETVAISGISPEDQPSAKELGTIADVVRNEQIHYIFLETLASPKLAETLASETGAHTLVLNPIEGLTPQDQQQGHDYFSLMRDNLAQLRLAMQCE